MASNPQDSKRPPCALLVPAASLLLCIGLLPAVGAHAQPAADAAAVQRGGQLFQQPKARLWCGRDHHAQHVPGLPRIAPESGYGCTTPASSALIGVFTLHGFESIEHDLLPQFRESKNRRPPKPNPSRPDVSYHAPRRSFEPMATGERSSLGVPVKNDFFNTSHPGPGDI